ncbi:hypothetical protein, partial [Streptomyces lavendulae]|uniref:hypothetical protein n=1 Tax=Streptomyces lavendulae TaxID=1914 RepID=UPI0031E8A05B
SPTATPALLSHVLTAMPDPEIPARGLIAITLGLRDPDAPPVYCRQLTVAVPTGAGPNALTTQQNIQTVTTWVPEPQLDLPGQRWSVIRVPADGDTTLFICRPQGLGGSRYAEFAESAATVTLSIGNIAVGAKTAEVALDITELTSADRADGYTRKSARVRVTTGPLSVVR